MLYKQKETPSLAPELFKAPTSEYRGTPFWAWNCKLDQSELDRQLEIFKKMGFGGAHMHVRTGMATKYLSEEFMTLIQNCVKKAKSENMLAWLYDEDRWPSGSAGWSAISNIPPSSKRNLPFISSAEKACFAKCTVLQAGILISESIK